ncbi:flagellar basal body P-ring formation protein FlgA [Sulfurimonas sp. SAG-AH-194-L11]|nr:flagellar basal body P-ring formation chaperone FlgA [Sulfurimonas sp. SAG-AH-194-L11]MDF1876880.1 flagellar basal body P-ring formation protein FlgA [Sulfurimonas sp. SAG-AH-194-L11]
MKLLFILSFTLLLYLSANTQLKLSANTQLKSNYVVEKKYVLVSDIIKNSNSTLKLFDIDTDRHSLRIKTKYLLDKLNKLGYKEIYSRHNYTQFTQKSPINTDKMELYLRELYEANYQNIQIDEISILPRSYLEHMPLNYTIDIHRNAYLSNRGIINIKTDDNKKIFFNYLIKAKVSVVVSKQKIQKDAELSILNAKKKSIMLKKFKASPLQKIENSSLQLKHRVKKGTILTIRDVVGLFLVKRGSKINVVVIDSNIAISFIAKAKQNGRLGESITIINSQGKKLKAVVTAKNSAEIR